MLLVLVLLSTSFPPNAEPPSRKAAPPLRKLAPLLCSYCAATVQLLNIYCHGQGGHPTQPEPVLTNDRNQWFVLASC